MPSMSLCCDILYFTDTDICLSFYYHMYGDTMGTLEVILETPGFNQTIFNKSSDQGNQWYFQNLYIQPRDNLQVYC